MPVLIGMINAAGRALRRTRRSWRAPRSRHPRRRRPRTDRPASGAAHDVTRGRGSYARINLALGALLAAASGSKKLADADCVQQALLDQEAP
jgi:hypothetical protein